MGMNKSAITNLVLEKLTGNRLFYALDHWIDEDWKHRAKIGQRIGEVVVVFTVVLLWSFRLLDARELI